MRTLSPTASSTRHSWIERQVLAAHPEEEWVPISALQHHVYCPRQCALIHVARVFDENLYTLRGRSRHERVHNRGGQSRPGIRRERSLRLWSEENGLTGKADVVEFEGTTICPVEHKVGKERTDLRFEADAVQLCAQALCLEEMFSSKVSTGILYYAGSKSRVPVSLDAELRSQTVEVIASVRAMSRESRLPGPVNDWRCEKCSLRDSCVPEVARIDSSVLDDHVEGLTGGIP